jgi:hypothetical protein
VHPTSDLFYPSAISTSGSGLSDEGFDDNGKSRQEVKTEIPQAPHAANLESFYVSPAATMNFFIDLNSISASADGVVRYTIVSKSRSGA